MSRSKWSTRRKSLAIGLAVVGVAGLSLASASQLTLNSVGSFQAGTASVTADCQGAPIPVTYSTPTLGTGGFLVKTVTFGSIDPKCSTEFYELAYTTSTGSTKTWTQVVSKTAVPGTSISFDLSTPTSVDASQITGWALSIHS